MSPLLAVNQLTIHYGPVEAVRGIDFKIEAQECIALLGANGAGKSSTLMALSGMTKNSGGSMMFCDEVIDSLTPSERFQRGLVQVPEGRGIFQTLSVEDNLKLGMYSRDHAEHDGDLDEVYGLFPRLKERYTQSAGQLSGGEQQMLAIGRALLARPKLLMLDEPSMGLAPKLVDRVFESLSAIHQKGVSLLIVEQNAYHALHLASRGYVMANGRIVLEGKSSTLREDPEVISAYLGGHTALP